MVQRALFCKLCNVQIYITLLCLPYSATAMLTSRSTSHKMCRCATGGVWVGGELCLPRPNLFRSWNAKQLEREIKTNIFLTPLMHVLHHLTPSKWVSSGCDLNSVKTLTLFSHSSCLTLYHPLRYSSNMAMYPLHWKRSSLSSAQWGASSEPWISYLFLSFRRDTSWVCCRSCFSSLLVEREYSNSWISSRLVLFSTCIYERIVVNMPQNQIVILIYT